MVAFVVLAGAIIHTDNQTMLLLVAMMMIIIVL